MMTKKDFEALAAVLKHRLENPAPNNTATVSDIAHEIAHLCGKSNARFNKHTFLVACGLA